MNSKSLKFAVSAAAIGITMVACKPAATQYGISSASAGTGNAEAKAAAAYGAAKDEAQKGATAAALAHAERAVQLSPRDVAYRMMLADLYLKDGRFTSAETTFEDVLALDAGNVRAGLSLALTRIAQGRQGAAIGQLDELREAPAADLGLAYALAGETARGIEILEPAARAPGAPARVRQNLALAYALAGDWQKARTTAAQDVSPDQLGARMAQWAQLAQPSNPSHQIATLLGVTPKADEGQPTRLALAPAAAPRNEALAAVAPKAEAPEAAAQAAQFAAAVGGPALAAEPAPVQFATAEAPAEIPAWVSAPQAATVEPAPQAHELSPVAIPAPKPVVKAAPVKMATLGVVRASAPAIRPKVRTASLPAPKADPHPVPTTGRFAVQLGAFQSQAAVERAWSQAHSRYGFSGRTPFSTTVSLPKGTFHRLSVAGFTSRDDASRVCQSVKAKGGSCFVRAIAGDAPVVFAARRSTVRRG